MILKIKKTQNTKYIFKKVLKGSFLITRVFGFYFLSKVDNLPVCPRPH